MEQDAATRPALRVIRGDATPEEIAAILAIVTARAPRPAPGPPRALRGGWNDRSTAMRPVPAPGPGAWRSAAWMR